MPTATPPTSTAAAIITSTRATASRSCSSPPACTATTTRSPTSRSTSTTSTWRGSTGWWPTWRCAWRTSITVSWWTSPSPTRTGSAGSSGLGHSGEIVQGAPGAKHLAIVVVRVRHGARARALGPRHELGHVRHDRHLEIHLQRDGRLDRVGPGQGLLTQGIRGRVADQPARHRRRDALGGVAAHCFFHHDAVHGVAEQVLGFRGDSAVPAGEHDRYAEGGLERGLDRGVGFGGHELAKSGVFRSAPRVHRVGLVFMDHPCYAFHIHRDVDAHEAKLEPRLSEC